MDLNSRLTCTVEECVESRCCSCSIIRFVLSFFDSFVRDALVRYTIEQRTYKALDTIRSDVR